MKKGGVILLILLILTAALLGWLLPTAVFDRIDRSMEGKPEPVSLRKVDLSYQTDLQLEDRMRMIQDYPMAASAPLERGVYLDADKAKDIMEAFLRTLTGSENHAEEHSFAAEPLLLNFGEEGAFLIWAVHLNLEGDWYCEAMLDDQTGLILALHLDRGTMQTVPWESLIPDFGSAEDADLFMCRQLELAIRNHYQAILSEAFTSSWELQAKEDHIGEVVLYENGSEKYRVAFILYLNQGLLRIGF